MTKCTIFKLIAIVAIVLGLAGICIVEDIHVGKSLSSVERYCYEIESASKEEGGILNGKVTALVDNLEDSWEKNESCLCFLVNHKSIEPLGVEIVKLKTYIAEEEETEFFVSLDLIKFYCETFRHFMGANFHNVL